MGTLSQLDRTRLGRSRLESPAKRNYEKVNKHLEDVEGLLDEVKKLCNLQSEPSDFVLEFAILHFCKCEDQLKEKQKNCF